MSAFLSFFPVSFELSFLLTPLSSFPNTIYWRGCLFPTVYSHLFCHRWIDHISVGLFLCFQFCSLYLCLFLLCQYHAVLMILGLQYSLKSGSMICPNLCFFLRFYWLFRFFCVSIHILKFFVVVFWENPLIFWEEWHHISWLPWWCGSILTNSFVPWAQHIIPFVCVIFIFFHQCLPVFWV